MQISSTRKAEIPKAKKHPFGFTWGELDVTRTAYFNDGESTVTAVITLTTTKTTLNVHVTESGDMRIFEGTKEWKPTP